MTGFNIRDLVGLVILAAFIGAMIALFFSPIPDGNRDLVTYMLGQLSGFVSAVVALHYVSKAGEKELDAERTANTGKALDAIDAALKSNPGTGSGGAASDAADQVAGAAVDEAAAISGESGR